MLLKHLRAFLILLLFPLLSLGQIRGRVVSIADGDTFTMLTADKRQVRVRLHGIDCPEKNQPFGQRAKQFTAGLIFGKDVLVNSRKKDRYQRLLGVVYVGKQCVNEALLQQGLAWHYRAYDKNPAWALLEQQARSREAGLWSDRNAVPPWAFRKSKRQLAH